MKNLIILGGIVLCLISLSLAAQVKAPLNESLTEKPLLFSALSDKSKINGNAIDKIFAGSSAGNVKIPIDDNKFLEGELVEKVRISATVTAVNIKLPHYDNALFTISRITTGNAVTYAGRIIHIRYGDVLLLKKDGEQLYLVKEKQSLFLVE